MCSRSENGDSGFICITFLFHIMLRSLTITQYGHFLLQLQVLAEMVGNSPRLSNQYSYEHSIFKEADSATAFSNLATLTIGQHH